MPILHILLDVKTIFLFLRSVNVFFVTYSTSCGIKLFFIIKMTAEKNLSTPLKSFNNNLTHPKPLKIVSLTRNPSKSKSGPYQRTSIGKYFLGKDGVLALVTIGKFDLKNP